MISHSSVSPSTRYHWVRIEVGREVILHRFNKLSILLPDNFIRLLLLYNPLLLTSLPFANLTVILRLLLFHASFGTPLALLLLLVLWRKFDFVSGRVSFLERLLPQLLYFLRQVNDIFALLLSNLLLLQLLIASCCLRWMLLLCLGHKVIVHFVDNWMRRISFRLCHELLQELVVLLLRHGLTQMSQRVLQLHGSLLCNVAVRVADQYLWRDIGCIWELRDRDWGQREREGGRD